VKDGSDRTFRRLIYDPISLADATDDRGYVYIVDRADTGLHILRLEGEAEEIMEGEK
jgi:hypothetical protein